MKKWSIILLLAAGCNSSQPKPGDYIIFGEFFGFCVGDKCIQMYQMTDQALYRDTKKQYPAFDAPYDGTFVRMNDASFNKVNSLPGDIPASLFASTSHVIGTPDAGDWGGIYFEISLNGERHFWLIDKMKSNLPEDVRPFAERLENAVDLLN